jgi:hypothetical protein
MPIMKQPSKHIATFTDGLLTLCCMAQWTTTATLTWSPLVVTGLHHGGGSDLFYPWPDWKHTTLTPPPPSRLASAAVLLHNPA